MDDVFAGRVDQQIATELSRLGQPHGGDFGQHDRSGSHRPGDACIHQPHRTGTEYDDHVARLHLALPDGVDRATERLGQRGLFGRHARRHLDHMIVDDRPLGDHHVLGHPARIGESHRCQIDAQVPPATAAVAAFAARDAGRHHDPLADGEAGHAFAHGVDQSGELVADGQRGLDARIPVPVRFQVGAADGTRIDPDPQLAGRSLRRGDFFDADIARSVVADGLHDYDSSGASFKMASVAATPRRWTPISKYWQAVA